MPTKVFLSVGSGLTAQQETFVSSVEAYLRANDLEPNTLGRNAWSSVQPLKAIIDLMERCSGTVVIALERTYIDQGYERRNTEEQVDVKDAALPTCWNQVEATMAYTLGKPLLVIVDRSLRCEGLLEKGYDWYVLETDIDPSQLTTPRFAGVIGDWKQRVMSYHDQRGKARETSPKQSIAELSIREIFTRLRPGELWKVVTALTATAVAIATIAYKVGTMMPR